MKFVGSQQGLRGVVTLIVGEHGVDESAPRVLERQEALASAFMSRDHHEYVCMVLEHFVPEQPVPGKLMGRDDHALVGVRGQNFVGPCAHVCGRIPLEVEYQVGMGPSVERLIAVGVLVGRVGAAVPRLFCITPAREVFVEEDIAAAPDAIVGIVIPESQAVGHDAVELRESSVGNLPLDSAGTPVDDIPEVGDEFDVVLGCAGRNPFRLFIELIGKGLVGPAGHILGVGKDHVAEGFGVDIGNHTLVRTDIIDAHGLGEQRGFIRVARPLSPDRNVQNQEERMVKHPGLRVGKIRGHQDMGQNVVDVPANFAGGPIDPEDVKAVGKGFSCRQLVGTCQSGTA